MTPIKYIGAKPRFDDHLFGTGLSWAPGQTHGVPADVAATMLRFPTFEAGSADEADSVVDEVKKEEEPEEIERDEPLANLEAMTKPELIQFAHRQFGVVLQPVLKKGELIDTIRLQMGKKVA